MRVPPPSLCQMSSKLLYATPQCGSVEHDTPLPCPIVCKTALKRCNNCLTAPHSNVIEETHFTQPLCPCIQDQRCMNSSPCLVLYAIGMTINHGIRVWLDMQVFSVLQPYTCWVCFCHHHNLSPHVIHQAGNYLTQPSNIR